MKNKLEKRNMTKFDYKARKLGFLGLVLVVLSCAVILPISASLDSKNVTLTNEIKQLNKEYNEEPTFIVEAK